MIKSLVPTAASLEDIKPMIDNHKLFTFLPDKPFELQPGQFVEISLPGVGSFPASACDLVKAGRIVSCIRQVGRVTEALHRLQVGARIGLRGPFGNGFSLPAFLGQDALLIAGGLGMAPLRALLKALIKNRQRMGRLFLLYGSREPGSLLFYDELTDLSRQGIVTVRFSVDFATALPGPNGGVVCQLGLVNELLEGLSIQPESTVAAVCGPPALYGCLLEQLASIGIQPNTIFATLERRMRCGIGECCHCVTAGHYICRDGPVYSLEQIRSMEGAI
ncbi:MAG: FAD/NAD(P)-binding protein [Deltaproteobacteria bacterium]|jgi:NAD(P)H-flavin reductase|nr:FAD/NAD(P)-binding protein [Deltaproteobacteria bacterium]